MLRLLILVGFVCLTFDNALAQPAKAPAGTVIFTRAERSVSALATTRRTPVFDAKLKEAVTALNELNRTGSASNKIDAQDLAQTALSFYLDHQHIELGADPTERELRARKAASDAGLREALGW